MERNMLEYLTIGKTKVTPMQPTRKLIDELYREKVFRARSMTPQQKLLAGPDLFDLACRIMADGIRWQFPDADEVRVQQILRQRLAAVRRREEQQ
jgi:hypothetical protein